MDGEARPLLVPPGWNSLALTENLNAELFGFNVRASGFGDDHGERDGEREPAVRTPPGPSMAEPRTDDERDKDGREPGVTDP